MAAQGMKHRRPTARKEEDAASTTGFEMVNPYGASERARRESERATPNEMRAVLSAIPAPVPAPARRQFSARQGVNCFRTRPSAEYGRVAVTVFMLAYIASLLTGIGTVVTLERTGLVCEPKNGDTSGQNIPVFPGNSTTTVTPSPFVTPLPTAFVTPTETPLPPSSSTLPASGSGTGTPDSTASGTNSGTGTRTSTASVTVTATATPSATASPTSSKSTGASSSATPTGSSSMTASASFTVTPSHSSTSTESHTGSATGSLTGTGTAAATSSGTGTSTGTGTATRSSGATPSSTPSAPITVSVTATTTPSPTASGTPSTTVTATISGTPSQTVTMTQTGTNSWTATLTPSPTVTPTASNSGTRTGTLTGTPSQTSSPSLTITATRTLSSTGTPSFTFTTTASQTASPSNSLTPSVSVSPSHTPAGASATSTPNPLCTGGIVLGAPDSLGYLTALASTNSPALNPSAHYSEIEIIVASGSPPDIGSFVPKLNTPNTYHYVNTASPMDFATVQSFVGGFGVDPSVTGIQVRLTGSVSGQSCLYTSNTLAHGRILTLDSGVGVVDTAYASMPGFVKDAAEAWLPNSWMRSQNSAFVFAIQPPVPPRPEATPTPGRSL